MGEWTNLLCCVNPVLVVVTKSVHSSHLKMFLSPWIFTMTVEVVHVFKQFPPTFLEWAACLPLDIGILRVEEMFVAVPRT
jgi:hypothetical protein